MTTTAKRAVTALWAFAVAVVVALCLGAGSAHAAIIKSVSCTPQQGSVEQVFPVQLKKGAIQLEFAFKNSSAYVEVNNLPDFSGKIIANSVTNEEKRFASVPTSGTYYMKITARASGTETNVAAAGIAQYLCYSKSSPKTLKNKKKAVASSCGDGSTVSYFKVKAKSRGYFSLNFTSQDGTSSPSFYVKFLNSKKKSLCGDWRYASKTSDVRGLAAKKKGTYYIAVKSYTKVYSITSTFKACKTKVKTKKSKAKKVKAKKTVKAVIAPGEKAAWYKFKNKKRHVVKINVNSKVFAGGNYGGVKIEVFKGSNRIGSATLSPSYPKDTLKSVGKLSKGTYRIKVSRTDTGCGYYTFKWK